MWLGSFRVLGRGFLFLGFWSVGEILRREVMRMCRGISVRREGIRGCRGDRGRRVLFSLDEGLWVMGI